MSRVPHGQASQASSDQLPPPRAATQRQYGQQPPYGQQTYTQLAYPPQYGQPISPQVVTVVTQQALPPTYLAWSILSVLFCCLPVGLAAVIMSVGVSNDWAMSQPREALRKSSIARMLNILALVLGLVIYIIVGVYVGISSSYPHVPI